MTLSILMSWIALQCVACMSVIPCQSQCKTIQGYVDSDSTVAAKKVYNITVAAMVKQLVAHIFNLLFDPTLHMYYHATAHKAGILNFASRLYTWFMSPWYIVSYMLL
jgi:hypothetical protein